MISEVIEVVKEFDALIAAIITGIITFLITRYSCNRNIPLEKMEIAYNRIYYPIYQLTRRSDDIKQIVDECEQRLLKYGKYVDLSTSKAFRYLKENVGTYYEKKAYENFKNNIDTFDVKLRKRLGYLEPNIILMYTCAAPKDKRLVRIMIELSGIYLLVSFFSPSSNQYAIGVISTIFLFLIASLVCECVSWIWDIVCNWIRRIWIKNSKNKL